MKMNRDQKAKEFYDRFERRLKAPEYAYMKRGDIIFGQGGKWTSKLIRMVDKGNFSHTAVAVSDIAVIEADVDTKVVQRNINMYDYNYIEVLDLGLTEEQIDAVMEELNKRIGMGYGYLHLVWYLIRNLNLFKMKRNFLNSPKQVICSELVYIVLEKSNVLKELGIEDCFADGENLTPNELYDLIKYASIRSFKIEGLHGL